MLWGWGGHEAVFVMCNESALLMKVTATGWTLSQTHARTNPNMHTHSAPSPGSYHYPSLHPSFGRPDRSCPITLSHFGPAYLSLYLFQPLSLSLSRSLVLISLPYLSFFLLISNISDSRPLMSLSHTLIMYLSPHFIISSILIVYTTHLLPLLLSPSLSHIYL